MIIVSFPRSGQHLVESILKYLCDSHKIPFSYCEFYGCCNQIPCKNNSLISKNHDFNLDLKIDIDIKYVALYRSNIIYALESYYRYWIKLNKLEYNYDGLLNFIINTSDYYNNFTKKWIRNDKSNIIKIGYYELISNPIVNSKRIFSHFFPEIPQIEEVFLNIPNISFDVYSGLPQGNKESNKIKLINSVSDELYKKLEDDLSKFIKLK